MTRTLTIMALALLGIAIVGAQAPAGQTPADRPAVQQSPAQERPASSGEKTDKVTATGCLKPGTSAGTWTLENVMMSAPAEAKGKAGETERGTAGAAGAKKTYNLIAKPSENLSPHANHKIEVTGTVSQAKSEAGAAPGAEAAQNFNVESFKMVAATCP